MSGAAALDRWFSLAGRVAVVTGGTGVLGGEIARGLAAAGARVAVLGRRGAVAAEVATGVEASGGEAMPLPADVLDRASLVRARDAVLDRWGAVDVLVNAAGGNVPTATVAEGASVFDVPETAWRDVVDLNLLGTVLPTAVFGAAMAGRDPAAGVVVNVSSMAASRPLSRVAGYSAAKAAVENLTRWLAVDLAAKHGPGMRVNAVAPGFFLGEQNRALLVGEDGEPTPRGRRILDHTPLGRFGEPAELVGTVVWLCSPAARFVTGVVVPVDGGYSAHGGV
ncbi:MAG: SDR family oxidoreductase [Kineosporiaceae bacterium]